MYVYVYVYIYIYIYEIVHVLYRHMISNIIDSWKYRIKRGNISMCRGCKFNFIFYVAIMELQNIAIDGKYLVYGI